MLCQAGRKCWVVVVVGVGGVSEHHTSREVYAAAEHISIYRYERLAGGESLKRRERNMQRWKTRRKPTSKIEERSEFIVRFLLPLQQGGLHPFILCLLCDILHVTIPKFFVLPEENSSKPKDLLCKQQILPI